MKLNLGMKVCGWAIVGLAAAGTARAQYGNGSIVGWGGRVVGADLSADFVAVAAGAGHSLGIKGYPRGDLDHDRDIDLHDFAEFANCHLGPDVPFPAGCDAADLDPDGDADLADFGMFQTLFTGPR